MISPKGSAPAQCEFPMVSIQLLSVQLIRHASLAQLWESLAHEFPPLRIEAELMQSFAVPKPAYQHLEPIRGAVAENNEEQGLSGGATIADLFGGTGKNDIE